MCFPGTKHHDVFWGNLLKPAKDEFEVQSKYVLRLLKNHG